MLERYLTDLMTEKNYFFFVLVLSFFIKIIINLNFEITGFPDSISYIMAGKQLFDNGIIYIENVMPLYPIIVYISDKTIGILNFNIFLSTINIYLVYKITELIFKDKFVAYFAATWMAVYPFNYYYSISVLTETTYVFLVLISFYYLYKGFYFFSSIGLVLCILTKPSLELIAPIFILLFSYYEKKNLYFAFKQFVKYFVVYIALMSPWWIHQYNKYGYFVRTNFGSSLVLYSGNNPLNKTGGGVILDQADLIKYPDKFQHVVQDYSLEVFKDKPGFKKISNSFPIYEGGREAYLIRHKTLTKAAISYIQSNPIRFLELAFLKFKRFWSPIPFSQEFQSYFLLFGSFISIVPIYFFSILGIYKIIQNKINKVLPLFFFCGYINLIHLITISSFRYRFPIEAFLIIFASYGFTEIIKIYFKRK